LAGQELAAGLGQGVLLPPFAPWLSSNSSREEFAARARLLQDGPCANYPDIWKIWYLFGTDRLFHRSQSHRAALCTASHARPAWD
jgi:hypothetical protein